MFEKRRNEIHVWLSAVVVVVVFELIKPVMSDLCILNIVIKIKLFWEWTGKSKGKNKIHIYLINKSIIGYN